MAMETKRAKFMIIGNIGFELMAPYLKELNIESILVMTTRDPINARLADKAYFFQENCQDFRPLYAMAVDNNVDTVISISGPDFANIRDSRLKNILDKSGIKTIANKFSASKIAADKLQTKYFLKNNNLPYVKGYKVEDFQAAFSAAEIIGYPVAIKNINDAGGTGFFISYTEQELKNKISSVDSYPVIIEEYVPGHEFSVEVLNYENKSIPLNPIYKGFTMPCGIHPMERLKISPPLMDEDSIELLKKLAQRVVTTMCLEPTGDVDFVWGARGLKVLEVNPRFGGVTAISMASSGINSYKMLIDMAIGKWEPSALKAEAVPTFDIPVTKPISDLAIDCLSKEPDVFRIKKQNLRITTGRITIQASDAKRLLELLDRINKKCDLFDENRLGCFLKSASLFQNFNIKNK